MNKESEPRWEYQYLNKITHNRRGERMLTVEMSNRANSFIALIPHSVPTSVCKLLADGAVMFYWSHTNLKQLANFEQFELYLEIMPSGRIVYDWKSKVKDRHAQLSAIEKYGIIHPDAHIVTVLDTPVRAAFEILAPTAVIPIRGTDDFAKLWEKLR